MKRLRLLFAACFLAASSALGMSAGALPVAASSGPELSEDQISEIYDIVYGPQQRAGFGGMVADQKAGLITIYEAAPGDAAATARGLGALKMIGTSADPKAVSLPKRWRIRYITEGPSLATLDSVIARLSTVQPFAGDLKDVLSGYGINYAKHVVQVDVTTLTPSLIAEGSVAFGKLVRFAVEPISVLTSGTAQQQNDAKPFFGGTKIITSAGLGCTGGYMAYNSATQHFGLLTDGHCFTALNQSTYQGQIAASQLMGNDVIRSFQNGSSDGAFVDTTAQGVNVDPDIYTSLPQGGNVTGTGHTLDFQTMCTDGSVTGENCSGTAQSGSVDVCHNFSDNNGVIVNVCHVTKVQGSSQLCVGGDSGGPVYSLPAQGSNYDSYTAYGLIEGVDPGTNDCWYNEIFSEESTLGPTVITGGVHEFTPIVRGNFQGTLDVNQYDTASGTSPGGAPVYKYQLIMQGDGNLVLYSPAGALWSSGTSVASSYAIMQGDGNLVIYRQGGIAVWSTHTYGNPGSWLLVQGDGNTVIYKPGNIPIWATNTCCSRP